MEQSCTETHVELVQRALDWGWRNPGNEIIEISKMASVAQNTRSGELLVQMGVVSEEQRNRWLAVKPESIPTVDWFARQDPGVVPYIDRIMAFKASYPYYGTLSVFSTHPCMLDLEVMHRADALDAAVMMIEEKTPVVIFSTFASLIKFRSMGRAERLSDPIIRAVGSEVYTAVSTRDEISSVLKKIRGVDEAPSGAIETANFWNAGAAENQNRPENREITRLIDHAISQGATDVALKPYRSGEIQIQIRKFGDMMAPKSLSGRINAELARQMINLLQSKSGANPTNTVQRIPTDGQMTYRSSAGDAFLRLSFIPLNHLGDLRNLTSVSIRILPRTESNVSLQQLGLEPAIIEQICFAMRMSQGLVLVVGPTNSGKSTTLAGAIGEHVKLFGESSKRLSVEDPVERFLYGVQQYNAPNHIRDEGERFEIILRAFKRHDPDIILVGEVRDRATANLCVSSASTGHLVLSTLHANDSVMAFDVLAKTVEAEKRFQLIESMSLVISQRLVKAVCPYCRTIEAPTDDEYQLFDQYVNMIGESAQLPSQVAHANLIGCERCEKGYIGIAPLNDALPFSRKAKDAAIKMLDGHASQRGELAQMRTITLLQSGLNLLAQYKIDIDSLMV